MNAIYWLLIGLIAVISSIGLFVYIYNEAKAIMNREKIYSTKRLGVFYSLSFFLVLASLIALLYGAYLSAENNSVDVEETILFAVASYVLTVGFAAVIYYSQSIENKSIMDMIDSHIDKKLGILTKKDLKEIFTNAANKAVREMELKKLRHEIKIEILEELKKDI